MYSAQEFRKHFPSLKRVYQNKPLTFLDGPGGTQIPSQVTDAITHYYHQSNSNTHGVFITTRETDETIERMRKSMAVFLGAEHPNTISVGQNMTTLNFALARGMGRIFQPGDEILITQLDHEGNRGPWLSLRERGIIIKEVRLKPDGRLDYEDMEHKLNERTRLLAMGMASNAIGTVNDVELARKLTYKTGTWLLLDAVHYAPHFSIDVCKIGCDFLLCSAYKFYGPHVGILYSRPGLLDNIPTDHLRTAGQAAPDKIETGTLNHAALAGVAAAAQFLWSFGEGNDDRSRLMSAYEHIGRHERKLAEKLYSGLSTLSGVKVIGTDFNTGLRAPTVSFVHHRYTAEEVCKKLAIENICAWDGHFYAQRAIEVLGLLEIGGVTRLGLSAYNTEEEISNTLKAIEKL